MLLTGAAARSGSLNEVEIMKFQSGRCGAGLDVDFNHSAASMHPLTNVKQIQQSSAKLLISQPMFGV